MKWRKIVKNRRLWVVTIIAFVVLLVFFDRNNLFERRKLKRQIHELEIQRDYYRTRIVSDSTILERLRTDNDYLEQYAREHYLMKRDSDFVYIIID